MVLVADAGLGTINGVRLSMDALATVTGSMPAVTTVVVLDRFDGHQDIHRRNRAWLADRLGYRVVTLPGQAPELADAVTGPVPTDPGGQAGVSVPRPAASTTATLNGRARERSSAHSSSPRAS